LVSCGGKVQLLYFPLISPKNAFKARNGSAVALKWQDIDFNNMTVTFQGEHSKTGVTVQVPIVEDLYTILKTWADQQGSNIEDTSSNERFVFTSKHQKENKRLSPLTRRSGENFCKKRGFPMPGGTI